jgi:starch synthase
MMKALLKFNNLTVRNISIISNLRVAVLSSEAVPYSKTGGLADVAGALPKALKQIDVDACLITPCYLQTKGDLLWHYAFEDLQVQWRGKTVWFKAFYSEANGSPTFLIDAPEFFHRSSIYGFREDYDRFAFFCHAALALIRRLDKPFDIVHLNDWHCGFAAVEIANSRRWDAFWANTRTVFSIHNLAYQGVFGKSALWEMGFGDSLSQNAFSFDGAACSLKAGLEVSDMLSTVSRRYSYEIQGYENGYGLDWLLRQRSNSLIGITNGVDYDEWNPATDKELPAHFDIDNMDGKRECKRQLLQRFSLPEELDRPIIASVTRLTSQKGIELVKELAGDILASGAFFISLGSGDSALEEFFQSWHNYAPNRIGIYRGYSEPLAHLIEAGADMFVMPSKFEPCGLNQMYSLRYGTIPIVRAVGGLDDTVENFNAVRGTGNGFKFNEFRSSALLDKIYEALFAYADKETWRKIQRNGMSIDNSWENAAKKYLQLYEMTIVNNKI